MQGSTQLLLALFIAMSGIRLIYAVEEESFATGVNTEMTQMTQLLCRDSEMVQQPEQAFEDFVEDIANSQGRGLASRIRPIPENIARIGNNTFALPVGAETSLRWQVYSANQQVSHYRFLLLVNGEQTFLTIDGETVPYVDLNLSAEAGIQTFDLEIPVQDEGMYDVILLVLSNIDQPPQPTGTVASTSINRITLVVEEAEVSTNDFEVLPSSGAMTEQQLSVALGVSLDGSLLGWSYPDPVHRVQSGDPIRFDVLAGYASPSNPGDGSAPFPETSPFALLLFLDYTQIPLIDDQMILYRSVPQDAAYTNISLELPALNELGLHEILVVRINNPGVPMCQQRGLPTDLWLDWSTIHLRAALEVVVAP